MGRRSRTGRDLRLARLDAGPGIVPQPHATRRPELAGRRGTTERSLPHATDRHQRIAPNVAARCRADIDTAHAFVDHLTASGHDLDDCPQACLDAWITTDRSRRLGFIRWLKRGGYLALTRLPEPVPRKDPDHEVDPDDQIALARRLLHEPDSGSIEDRAAACLILLYAQPAAKLATLTINDRRVDGSTGVIELAHRKGLLVHTWTFRDDASGYGFADPKAEMQYYMRLGIDGVFTDFPATGVAAVSGIR